MLRSIIQLTKANYKSYESSKRTADSRSSFNLMERRQDTDSLLEVEGLYSGYNRNKAIIHDLSYSVRKGEIVGLIGANGAGKSTTIKASIGLIPVFKGKVKLPDRQAGGYAYIPELPALYEELTLWEHLEIVAMANNMEENTFEERAEQLLTQFNMKKHKYSFPAAFSKGMRQKVMILCSCLIQPDLYLVDEPFNGLDPYAIKELLNWFSHEKNRGAGILLSTHVLDIAARICNRLIIMDDGQIIATGSLSQLQNQAKLADADLFDIYDKLLRR